MTWYCPVLTSIIYWQFVMNSKAMFLPFTSTAFKSIYVNQMSTHQCKVHRHHRKSRIVLCLSIFSNQICKCFFLTNVTCRRDFVQTEGRIWASRERILFKKAITCYAVTETSFWSFGSPSENTFKYLAIDAFQTTAWISRWNSFVRLLCPNLERELFQFNRYSHQHEP